MPWNGVRLFGSHRSTNTASTTASARAPNAGGENEGDRQQ